MPPRCAPAPCTSRPGGRRGCGDLWKRGERRGHSPGRPSSLCPAPASEPAPGDAAGPRAGSRLGYQTCLGWGSLEPFGCRGQLPTQALTASAPAKGLRDPTHRKSL